MRKKLKKKIADRDAYGRIIIKPWHIEVDSAVVSEDNIHEVYINALDYHGSYIGQWMIPSYPITESQLWKGLNSYLPALMSGSWGWEDAKLDEIIAGLIEKLEGWRDEIAEEWEDDD